MKRLAMFISSSCLGTVGTVLIFSGISLGILPTPVASQSPPFTQTFTQIDASSASDTFDSSSQGIFDDLSNPNQPDPATKPSSPKPSSSSSISSPASPANDPLEEMKRSPQRWIEIRLRSQRLLAWEGDKQVYAVIVSTGKSYSPTPKGTFAIQSMHRVARMQGDDYDVPDVPYVMYYSGNYGIHGAYWHNNFGTPVSHGCTNVAVDHAKWLFGWATIGTPVVVRD